MAQIGAPPYLDIHTAIQFITVEFQCGGSYYSPNRERLYLASSNMFVNAAGKFSNKQLL